MIVAGRWLARRRLQGGGGLQLWFLGAGQLRARVRAAGWRQPDPGRWGSDNTKDSDPNPSTGRTGLLPLASGQSDVTVDAGLVQNFTVTVGSTTVVGSWDDPVPRLRGRRL